MRSEILAEVSEELLSISPLIFRLVRRRLARTTVFNPEWNITHLHFEIMRLLEDEGTLHVSEIGMRLQIAKAQMTRLIDKLEALNFVERKIDAADRRTFNITLTVQARHTLSENKAKITCAMQEIISSLSEEDLKNLSLSLRSLRDILLKAQSENSQFNAEAQCTR